MRYRLVEAEKAEHSISRLCKVLGVSRRGFHARRLIDGFPEWKRAGLPVAAGEGR